MDVYLIYRVTYNGHVCIDVIVSKLKLDWDTVEITLRLQNYLCEDLG